ncbi:CLUMA_CG021613, isoform A [Clunio marinus]|uniref:CLUMA_CG021613, isoform A n=1 Tax=Clunio marinus TaxID=568069 RepID=A0A1J1J9E2_9DIPT|nr:CLUMA_CG021613, isoform A [Clunio marinus]
MKSKDNGKCRKSNFCITKPFGLCVLQVEKRSYDGWKSWWCFLFHSVLNPKVSYTNGSFNLTPKYITSQISHLRTYFHRKQSPEYL